MRNLPLRVLHCYAGNLYGGVETLLRTLARPTVGMESSFGLCFEGRLAAEMREAGATVHMLAPARFSRPWRVWQARGALGRLLANRPSDVVVCHDFWPHWLCGPAIRRARRPLVCWMHDVARGHRWVERLAARTPPDLVLANSRYTAATVPLVFPAVRHEVLYPPVAPPGFDRSPEARAAIRSELTTPDDATVIVLASRLEPLKGHATLLDALGRLVARPGWVAWIAGRAQRPHERAYLEALHARAASAGIAGRVRFLGHRTDIPRVLAAADIYCQPNAGAETFGIAFVEALDAGLPVVSTRLGGVLEIVTEACGVLIPPDDPVALAGALGHLIDHPEARRRLGMAGPARARSLCDPAALLARLEALLREVGTR